MLNIKEIFKSDLDPNSTIWWANAKVDKINYNFSQLILGGPQGPQGNTGYSGSSGARGVQGFQGPNGAQGPQGPQGSTPGEAWIKVSNTEHETLLPKYNGDPANEFTAVRVVFSDFITNLTDELGPDGNPGQDGVPDTAYSINAPILVNDGVLINYVHDISKHNIDLRNDVAETIGRRAYIDLENISNNDTLIIKGDSKIMVTHDYLDILSGVESYMTLNPAVAKDAGLTIHSNTSIQSDANVTGKFKYNNLANAGRVLTADNTTGETTWRLKHEVIGTFPVGSIIAINEFEFNNANFHLDRTLTVQESTQEVLNMFYGAGKVGGKYEGWYLCNGETWTDANGILQFSVPNLNNFEYQIDSNLVGQNATSGGDNSIILIGGIALNNDAEYIGPDTYSILQESTYTDEQIQLSYNVGNYAYMSRNIHVVYLGQNGLRWNNVNGGVAPVPTETIFLAGPSTSSTNACAGSTSSYIWTGIGKNWSDLQEDLSGVTLYTTNNSPAPVKWYAKDNVARYWNGTQFTFTDLCPVQQTVQLAYNQDVTQLNGNITSGQNYVIDSLDFASATTLLNDGFNALAGWYKVSNQANGARRYWSGLSFIGETINETYITYVGEMEFSIASSADICDNQTEVWDLYAGTDNTYSVGTVSDLNDLYFNGATIYVHEDWIGTTPKVHPLVKVKSQNGLNWHIPYQGLLDSVSYRANIQSTSKVYAPVLCGDGPVLSSTIIDETTGETFTIVASADGSESTEPSAQTTSTTSTATTDEAEVVTGPVAPEPEVQTRVLIFTTESSIASQDTIGLHPIYYRDIPLGSNLTLPSPTWTVEGKSFIGWTLDSSPDENSQLYQPDQIISVGNNGIFYAAYEEAVVVLPDTPPAGFSPFTIIIETTDPDQEVGIPFWWNNFNPSRTDRNIYTDWGDGTVSPNFEHSNWGHPSHVYATPGTYTIKVYDKSGVDKVTTLNQEPGSDYAHVTNNWAEVVKEIVSWGDFEFTSLAGLFKRNSVDTLSINPIMPNYIPATVTDLSEMFLNHNGFNQDISSWDTSNVTNMSEMFKKARSFNQPLNTWNTSNVTDMSQMFSQAMSFNQPLNNWDTSSVTDMSRMFFYTEDVFNQDISSWDTSNVTDFTDMFYRCYSFNQPIGNWNMSSAVSIHGMLYRADSFNQPLNNWDVSNVQDMHQALSGTLFDHDLSSWDTSNVTDMSWLFYLTPFNQDISMWNTSNVTSFRAMFDGNDFFNQPIGSWNTSSATDMSRMFSGATLFNQDLSGWDVSNVQNFYAMFRQSSFNKPLSSWDMSSATDLSWMFAYLANFNHDLSTWDVSNATLMVGTFYGCESFNQPLNSWNVTNVTNMEAMFLRCVSFNQPLNNWNVVNVSNMSRMFSGASLFNQYIGNWNLNSLTNMKGILGGCAAFNQDVSEWNISKVTDLTEVFAGATLFNQPLNNWDVSNVTRFYRMFSGAESFNQPLDNWDTSSAESFNDMFSRAVSFNQDISMWDTSNVGSFAGMFSRASSFNQPLNTWNTSKLTAIGGMFNEAISFNQDLSNWDVSHVINFGNTFKRAYSFNGDISTWTPIVDRLLIDFGSYTGYSKNISTMDGMFEEATSFNGDISSWDVSNIRRMEGMFNGATSFNQDIGNWDTSYVGWMNEMFKNATSFNQDLSMWCVKNVRLYDGTIGVEPDGFDDGATAWVGVEGNDYRPVWGTCPER